MDPTKDIALIKQCDNAFDIYRQRVTSLSYCPDTFFVTENGRTIAKDFASIDDARAFIENIESLAA